MDWSSENGRLLLREIARLLISIAGLALGIFLIFQSDQELRNVGFATTGTVIGYWLK
jgi:hypothetical protein